MACRAIPIFCGFSIFFHDYLANTPVCSVFGSKYPIQAQFTVCSYYIRFFTEKNSFMCIFYDFLCFFCYNRVKISYGKATFMKTVFITGASSGIGLACAELFNQKGWRVIGTSRSAKENPFAEMIPLELNSNESIEAAFDKAFSMAKIDLVVQCAGAGTAGAFEDFSDEQLAAEIDTLFTGAARVIKAAVSHLRKQNTGGRIVVIGSVAGRIPLPYQNVYSACKAALLSLVSSVRLEVRQFGIEMCVVEPGDTKTGFTAARRFTQNMSYGKDCEHAIAAFERDELNGVSPMTSALEVWRSANRKHLRAHYAVCFQYKLLCFIFAICPGFIREFALKMLYLK